MANPGMHLNAGGTIRPSRFVKVSADFTGVEANANDRIVGIAGDDGKHAPLSDLVTSNPHAEDGDPITLHGPGHTAMLELGGTVTAGDYLKSDADGKGVVIATSGGAKQNVGAIALQGGASGEIIQAYVVIFAEDAPA